MTSDGSPGGTGHGDGDCADRGDSDHGDYGHDPDAATGEAEVSVSVPGMDCPSCAGKVESSVEGLDGVDNVRTNAATGDLTVSGDPESVTPATVTDRVEAAGYEVDDDHRTERFDVPEMDCPSCAGKVTNAVEGLPGVVDVDARPTTGTLVVTYDLAELDSDRIVAAVEGAGYEVLGTDGGDGDDSLADHGLRAVLTSDRALKTWVGAVLVSVGIVLEFLLPGANATLGTWVGRTVHLVDALFVLGVVASGTEIVRNGYYSLQNRSLDIDLLMGVAIVAATGVGLYVEAGTLAVLFSVAELLERYAMDRARNSLRELMELSPDEATVRRDGEEVTVPADEVRVGEVVLVRPGERVPVDGVVVEGSAAVNQAPVTGESVPVDKVESDEVYAGTIAEDGYLEVEATAAADDSTIARVVDLVENANRERTDREQFVERFAAYYTPVVVAAAILTAAVPPLVFGQPWREWFVAGLTLLVVSCPCAFVISTPVSVVSAVTSAARNGVLITGASRLEAMGEVSAVALDKTGTLTRGELTVTDVVPFHGHTEADVLQCARGVERRSEHPIADAIVSAADDVDGAAGGSTAHAHGGSAAAVRAGGHAEGEGVAGHAQAGAVTDDRSVDGFESLTGKGVRADVDGVPHVAGKPGLFEELGFSLDHVHVAADEPGDAGSGDLDATTRDLCARHDCLDLLEDTIPRLRAEGKTVVLVGTEDRLEGVVAVADEVRPGARAMVQRLHDLGIESVVMLTGDNETTARAVADQVGVDEVRAELLPEDKVTAVEELVAEYDGVAMVGDGINDAPALATATVGIAMGAAGTDTAIETADVALMGDDIGKLPYLVDLSRQTVRVIRQNVWTSLGVKALLAVGVPLMYVSVAMAVLIGDAGMTLGVTGNAMRLARIRPETLTDAE